VDKLFLLVWLWAWLLLVLWLSLLLFVLLSWLLWLLLVWLPASCRSNVILAQKMSSQGFYLRTLSVHDF